MIELRRTALAGVVLTALVGGVSAQQAPQAGAQQPATPPPVVAAPAIPGTATCPTPAPPAKAPERLFNAPVGLLMQPVLATRVADYEKFLGHVFDALASTTDATVRAQAKGWRVFKMSETGPNGDVLFAFLLDPAVPCVDYAFGPILAAAIPDAAKLTEVWNLNKASVRSGGTLMNLVPVTPPK